MSAPYATVKGGCTGGTRKAGKTDTDAIAGW